MQAVGSNIVQADRGATAKLTIYQTVYQAAVPAPVDGEKLDRAEALLAELPLDVVPLPTGLPPGSWLPLLRNALFVGREADLRALAATLKAGTAAVGQSIAVTGMGGVGKSQLACEFAYRYGRYFAGGVFWLSCANPAAIPAEIATCGRGLNLPAGSTGLPLDEQVALVAQAWQGELPRLLILDNCGDEAVLENWVPRGGGCRVLVTARRGIWRPELGVMAISLGVLTRTESVALLRGHLVADDPALDAIAAELGDLPLALHLAGKYLALGRHEAFGRPAAYLAALQRSNLLEHQSLTLEGRSPTGHEQHVARTFALSWGQLEPAVTADAMARSILARAVWFAAGEPIPRELLRVSAGVEDEDEAAAARFACGLARVQELGLATEQQDGALVLHRLVAAFIRGVNNTDANEAARAAVERAVGTEAQRLNQHGDPRPLLIWQLQLRAVAEAAGRDGRPNAALLLGQLGLHLQMIADRSGARAALEWALKLDECTYGADHPKVAIQLNNLGMALGDEDDLDGAKAMFERALKIDLYTFGPNHPEVADVVSNLGVVLHKMFERARKIEQNTKPTAADDVSDLGPIQDKQYFLNTAKTAFVKALEIDECTVNYYQAKLAIRATNLGGVLRDEGDLDGARVMLERALEIGKRHPSPDHPKIATRLSTLGGVLYLQGMLRGGDQCLLAEALKTLKDALTILERVYVQIPDHPEVAGTVYNLGLVLGELGDLAGAREAFEQALPMFQSRLGKDHRTTNNVSRSLETVTARIDASGSAANVP